MNREVYFPTLGKSFQPDGLVVFRRTIQTSNLIYGVRRAFEDYYGREEGRIEFSENSRKILKQEINQVVNFFQANNSRVIYPISKSFKNSRRLNMFTRVFSEIECALSVGGAGSLFANSCAFDEEYYDYIPQGDEDGVDLQTILTLESIRDNSHFNQKGLHMYLGELSKELLEHKDENLHWNGILERINEMPERFYSIHHKILH